MSNEVPSIDSLLNADLTGVDTSFPVLQKGIVSTVIAECVAENSKNEKPILRLKLTTAHPCQTLAGDSRPAGFPLRHMISLTPTEKYDPRQGLAQLKEAVFGDKSGGFGDPSIYVGKPVTVRLDVENSEEYGTQNRIKAFVKLAS
jgi:hypothetical protein